MRWAAQVAHMGEERKLCEVLVGNSGKKETPRKT
jgi:hypothetical protein